jgi:cardiolipin synthase
MTRPSSVLFKLAEKEKEIYDAYINSFTTAKEIVIVGSYFLPGRRMNTALKKAAIKLKLN